MVIYEEWDKTRNQITKRENIKFTDALTILNIFDTNTTYNGFNVEKVDVFQPYTENRVIIRTHGNKNYHFKFTMNQYLKIKPQLMDLNGGEEIEQY